MRRCARPACGEPASATLTYRYASGEVWIGDLAPRHEPHAYDLCVRHADRLTVPGGWRLDDHRGGRGAAARVG